jgi:hypothetical protein
MNKTLTKLSLDIILTVLFIVLIYPRETGFTFHEIAGLASGALVIFHLILNWPWVKNITGNLFNPKVKGKTKLFYLLNTLSLVTLIGIMITGIQISTVLFPGTGTVSHFTFWLHKWLSYACLGFLGLHLTLHWSFFVQTVPRMFKSPRRPAPGKVALNLAALGLSLGLMFMQFGFTPTDRVVSSATLPATVYSNDAVSENRSSSDADSLPAASVGSSPRGNGNKQSSAVAAIVPSAPSSISSSSTNISSSASLSTGTTSGSAANQITLTQYLSNLYCTGCSKHCSLLSPQCSIGVSQAAAAEQKYIAIYSPAALN